MRPGMLLDLYVLRRGYDDLMHGIERGDQDDHDISSEDEALFEEENHGRTGD